MPDAELTAIRVRPIMAGERVRFDAEVAENHWPRTTGWGVLGWVSRCASRARLGKAALVGFSAAALAFKPGDPRLGRSDDQHFRRLRYMTDNQRFCVRPGLDSCRMRSAGSAFVRSVQRSFMRT